MKQLKCALIGVGGFGKVHVKTIRQLEKEGILTLRAAVDPALERNPAAVREFEARGVEVSYDYQQYLSGQPEIDFVVISTPLYLHQPIVLEALNQGYPVLTEKPPATTIQDLDQIIQASEENNTLCMVDYEYTACKNFRTLCEMVGRGVLGEITDIRAMGAWQRSHSYFTRNGWAGKTSVGDKIVLDGVTINALSHMLNNMLQIAEAYRPCEIDSLRSELYHANPIEGEDVSCLELNLSNGCRLLYYATLCHSANDTPYLEVYGTRGRARWAFDTTVRITSETGRTVYADPVGGRTSEELVEGIYRNLIGCLQGKEKPFSPLQNARNTILAVNGAYQAFGRPAAIPKRFVREIDCAGEKAVYLPGLEKTFRDCMERGVMLHKAGLEWTVSPGYFCAEGYDCFSLPCDQPRELSRRRVFCD